MTSPRHDADRRPDVGVPDPGADRSRAGALWRIALRLALIALLAYGLHLLSSALMTASEALPQGTRGVVQTALIAILLLGYAVLIAAPFVPGVEIGVSLLMMRGAEVAPFVYAATVAGLYLAFLIGRYLPQRRLWQMLCDLRLSRAAALVQQVETLSLDQRLALLRARVPTWLGGIVTEWRYPTLGVLLNLPGNALIGGGGGICLMAGLSRMFAALPVLVTLAVAVAPVPLVVWFYGMPAWLG